MNIKLSSKFKSQIIKTILSIILFICVYLFLFAATCGLVVLSFYFSFYILSISTAVPILGLSLAIIVSTITVFYYLIKFIFSTSKSDYSHLTEITQEDEPELFKLINKIAKEVGTSSPKKVYLSYDVNASVFYNSNFWSMFLPIRKNLQIGVGLINSVSTQELTAILAHEFGHFSQKSMKLGSFVYNVNMIIYNMLYNNESVDKMNEKWASMNGYATIFISLSKYIIKGIQEILQQQYKYININYLSLSREMEFHADEIAANVAGSKALSEALLRIQYADAMLNNTLNYYYSKISTNQKSQNLYHDQFALMKFYAEKNDYTLRNGLPIITLDHIKRYQKSKLNIVNQWATHPTDEDRISALNKINISQENNDNSLAIEILIPQKNISKVISDKLFSTFEYTNHPTEINTEEFLSDFKTDTERSSFSPLYNQYFDYTSPISSISDLSNTTPTNLSLKEIFSTEKTDDLLELNALYENKETLELINKGEYKVKDFEYDSVKYKSSDATEILALVNKSIEDLEAKIKVHKNDIFRYFFNLAKLDQQEDHFYNLYLNYATYEEGANQKLTFYQNMLNKTQFIFEQTPYENITINLNEIKQDELILKNSLNNLLKNNKLTEDLNSETMAALEDYTSKEIIYFNQNTNLYIDKNLEILFTAINQYHFLITRESFLMKKELLDYQASLAQSLKVETV